MLTPTVPGTLALGYELTVLADGQDFGLGLENVDGLALSGADLLFSLTTEFTDPTPTAFDRDDLIGCLGFTPAVLPSTTDTCIAPLTLEFDADVLHANNAGQVDGYSVG